jgi:hypothetical protein
MTMDSYYEEAVKAADAALEHARKLPQGPGRSSALKAAGKLRSVAEGLKKQTVRTTRGRRSSAIGRPKAKGK